MNRAEQYRFLKVVSKLFDETPDRVTATWLTQRITEDPGASALYLGFVELDIELEELCNAYGTQELAAAESELHLPSAEAQSPVGQGDRGGHRLLPALVSHRSPAMLASTLAVALLFYGSFVLLAWNLRPDEPLKVFDSERVPVAVVHAATDATWSKEVVFKPADSSILSGQPLKIESGAVELELKAGTKIVVEGPAEWTIDDNNRVSLQVGKLLARVPRQAIGFIVGTPTAKVVDLGTEFGVEVDANGATDIQVSKGKVQVVPAAKNSGEAVALPILISAGKAARVERASGGKSYAVMEIKAIPNRFVHGVSADAGLIAVRDAVASSVDTIGGHRAQYLINGRGLNGNSHVNSARTSMWLSAPGEASGVFVLFDLGSTYRLSSMKVWNNNDVQYDGFRTSGVKQADIYVSTSGKGTPLSSPHHWKLVVTDRQLTTATGNPNYNTPDVILLPHVAAKYVAIVVDEAWQLAPRIPAPLFTFAAPSLLKFDDGLNSPAMYGCEFVTSESLDATGLGAWIGNTYRTMTGTNSAYTAAVYKVQDGALHFEQRVTIPAGTAIDALGFAYVPIELRLAANTHYVVVAHLGTTTVQKTPYAYGTNAGKFGHGTTFVRDRYAHTDEINVVPASTAESLRLGPILGGNLLVRRLKEADPSERTTTVSGVGLSEVQFFGKRLEPATEDQ